MADFLNTSFAAIHRILTLDLASSLLYEQTVRREVLKRKHTSFQHTCNKLVSQEKASEKVSL